MLQQQSFGINNAPNGQTAYGTMPYTYNGSVNPLANNQAMLNMTLGSAAQLYNNPNSSLYQTPDVSSAYAPLMAYLAQMGSGLGAQGYTLADVTNANAGGMAGQVTNPAMAQLQSMEPWLQQFSKANMQSLLGKAGDATHSAVSAGGGADTFDAGNLTQILPLLTGLNMQAQGAYTGSLQNEAAQNLNLRNWLAQLGPQAMMAGANAQAQAMMQMAQAKINAASVQGTLADQAAFKPDMIQQAGQNPVNGTSMMGSSSIPGSVLGQSSSSTQKSGGDGTSTQGGGGGSNQGSSAPVSGTSYNWGGPGGMGNQYRTPGWDPNSSAAATSPYNVGNVQTSAPDAGGSYGSGYGSGYDYGGGMS